MARVLHQGVGGGGGQVTDRCGGGGGQVTDRCDGGGGQVTDRYGGDDDGVVHVIRNITENN